MGLIKQLETIEHGRSILANATRASQQFSNSANSIMADLTAFEASLPSSGLDQATLDEITALKTQTVSAIQSQLADLQNALAAL